MNIGQAAKASGVSAKMIRYYEQTDLIPEADRTASGYRDYSDSDVHMLRFIRRARDLGFSVNEINELLELWRLAQGHVHDLERKIQGLQDMVHTLTVLIKSCRGDHRPDCPILQRLENDAENEDLTIKRRSGAVARTAMKRA